MQISLKLFYDLLGLLIFLLTFILLMKINCCDYVFIIPAQNNYIVQNMSSIMTGWIFQACKKFV